MMMDKKTRDELIEYLSHFVTPNKINKIEQVLENRTHYVAVVLEDIYKAQNASATIRTSECLGVQNLHVIENRNRFRVSPSVTQGAAKWVTIHEYHAPAMDNTETCIRRLHEQGYRVVATSPEVENCYSLENVPLDLPVAFMFGNEEEGLSERALELADAYLRLPMYGFTQSYNISVSVAITLSHVIDKLHKSNYPWRLTEDEKADLKLAWYRKIVRRHEILERQFLDKQNPLQSSI
jgi:tRNA (guanosine-2'-O-)-methyltransferase